MKIRTRLFLFLLPTLIGSIALVSALLAYKWHQDIIEGAQVRLKSGLMVASSLVDPSHPEGPLSPSTELTTIMKELSLSHPSIVPTTEQSSSFSVSDINSSLEGKHITGKLPLLNSEGAVDALLIAEMNIDRIDEKFQDSLVVIIICASCATFLMAATLLYISNKISNPVQSLNNSALAIAAGQYGETASVEGPIEITELANTLNTMSECLLENINRLKENSLLRERMYGEHECAMLLQHLMLQKNIDDCRSDAVAVKALTLFSDTPRGLLLDFPKSDKPAQFHIHMAEAVETGFEGMYELLTQYRHSKDQQTHTSILFDRASSTLHWRGPHQPFFWSLDQKRPIEVKEGPLPVESGDLFFLFSEGATHFFKEQRIPELLTKVLKIFAQDGLETTASMLQKELAFATKRKELAKDIHFLCFQIL